tara:strand:+ start:271 stop:1164 length:894 start_codon:yes stop_codon:yes gene_type:complete
MTTSVSVEQLYADIIADLQPYYDDAVLLPNPQLISTQFNIAGTSGNQINVPLTDAFVNAGTVGEGNSIIATPSPFTPTSANITMVKRGVGTNVTAEALEDGGMAVVRNAVLTRLSAGLAGATDGAGFAEMKSGFDATDYGVGGATAAFTTNFVFSPEALAYGAKREPMVTMFYDNDLDKHQFRGTVRNGFKTLRAGFGARVTSETVIGAETAASLTNISKAVAALRAQNAPGMLNGAYIAIIDSSLEYSIASQLNSVTQTAIGDLSVVGNRALLTGLIGQAAGCEFYRSNSLPNAVA